MAEHSKHIIFKDKKYASIVNVLSSPEGLSFVTEDEDFIQIGIWNYKKNTKLPNHYHNTFDRNAERTSECVFVLKGSVTCNLFTDEGVFIGEYLITENELMIQYVGAHEYIINEDSVVLESKNGPYFGPDTDRTRVDYKKN